MPVPVVLTGRYVTVSGLEHHHADALYDALAAPTDDALWTYRFGERPRTRERDGSGSSAGCWRTRPT